MVVNDEKMDSILEVSESLFACLKVCDEKGTLATAKRNAIEETLKRVAYYRERGIKNNLVHTIWGKRMRLIKQAQTLSDVRQ